MFSNKKASYPFSGNKTQNVLFFILVIVGICICQTDFLAFIHEESHVRHFTLNGYNAEVKDNTHTRVKGWSRSNANISDMKSGYWGEFTTMVFFILLGMGISNTQKPSTIRNHYFYIGFPVGYMWALIPFATNGSDFYLNQALTESAIQAWYILTIPTAIILSVIVFMGRILLIGRLK